MKLQKMNESSIRGIFDPHTGQLYRLSMSSPKSTSHSISAISHSTNSDKYDLHKDLGFSMPMPYDLLTVEREEVYLVSSEATQAQACRDDLSCGTSDFQGFRKVYLSIA